MTEEYGKSTANDIVRSAFLLKYRGSGRPDDVVLYHEGIFVTINM